jgi:hypothetical protein
MTDPSRTASASFGRLHCDTQLLIENLSQLPEVPWHSTHADSAPWISDLGESEPELTLPCGAS